MRRLFLRVVCAAALVLGIGGALIPLTSAHGTTATVTSSMVHPMDTVTPYVPCNALPGCNG